MADNFNCKDVADCRNKLADWLLKEEGVPLGTLDGNGDGRASFAEAAAYIYKSPRWQEFLTVFDKIGLKHPLDPRGIPARIKARVLELKAKVEEKIKKKPGDEGYCAAFLPAFVEAGKKSYQEGGACLGASPRMRTWQDIFTGKPSPKSIYQVWDSLI